MVFFFKQKTAYEMRISDWSSDVCSSDLVAVGTEASDAPVSDRNCLRHTGSHITASENAKARRAGKAPEKCANAFGRAYDREDIERTGAMDVKQALQMLDPAIH